MPMDGKSLKTVQIKHHLTVNFPHCFALVPPPPGILHDYKDSLFSVSFMPWILPCPLKKAQDLLSQMYVYVYVCMHVCMSVYLYVYMYVYVCGFAFASSRLP